MRIRFATLATTLGAAALLSAVPAFASPPTSVERGIWVQQGQTFKTQVGLERAVIGNQGTLLPKGTYEVHFNSLGENKVLATFFQGGVRKGEANGIIIINSEPIPDDGKPHRGKTFADVGLRSTSPHTQTMEGGKLNLTIGAPGGSRILIGLLVPAVQKVREAAARPH